MVEAWFKLQTAGWLTIDRSKFSFLKFGSPFTSAIGSLLGIKAVAPTCLVLAWISLRACDALKTPTLTMSSAINDVQPKLGFTNLFNKPLSLGFESWTMVAPDSNSEFLFATEN